MSFSKETLFSDKGSKTGAALFIRRLSTPFVGWNFAESAAGLHVKPEPFPALTLVVAGLVWPKETGMSMEHFQTERNALAVEVASILDTIESLQRRAVQGDASVRDDYRDLKERVRSRHKSLSKHAWSPRRSSVNGFVRSWEAPMFHHASTRFRAATNASLANIASTLGSVRVELSWWLYELKPITSSARAARRGFPGR